MGMDVYGIKPKSKTGEYFRRNVWGWHPLWAYCEALHPELVSTVEYGHSNSGDGLNRMQSMKLAKALKEDIRSLVASDYIKSRDQYLADLPDEPCEYCDENGNRTFTQLDGQQIVKVCNSCSGKKFVRPFTTNYFLDLQDIKDFAQFLENSGGFKIW